MQTQPLQIIPLAAAGQPGQDGTQFWDGSNDQEAPYGRLGRHGCDPQPPSPGGPGGEIQVFAAFSALSPDVPGLVQVRGEGPLNSHIWEVSSFQELLIDCHGGNGGRGGVGENGQPGGQGEKGIDATRYTHATNGRPGYRGGDAGQGTDGAFGGDGGHIYITVDERDMDTLLALRWNVAGGVGGESGRHGASGRGGRGGPGGAGCTWQETHYRTWTDGYGVQHTEDYTTHHSHPPGFQGPNGPSGRSYTRLLSAGRGGTDGFCQIRVLRDNTTDEIYQGRYGLVVHSFEVADENDDGINEPGEYLLVKNIFVENIGDMRSPSCTSLKVLIRPTSWLEPVATEPLELPPDIPAGATVRVPGVLRALIKNECQSRPPGSVFYAEDTVSLVAFSERLQRSVPEFGGAQLVVYQYPVVMSLPKYLNCVAKGDRVKFSWMIKNLSKKAYGGTSDLHRAACTFISDPNGVFNLEAASLNTPHDVSHPIEFLEAGTEAYVPQYLIVSDLVPAFSTGQMVVGLALSDPHNPDTLRTIVSFDLSIQISQSYQFNPLSSFLVVVNASTPNPAILQLISFVERGLQLPVDVFNLNLVGSFTSPQTQQSLFSSYVGKSVIIFANAMEYFQNGMRDPWDLMDPWEVCQLAKARTSFLFIYPNNVEGLKKWAQQMVMPAYLLRHLESEASSPKPTEILNRLVQNSGYLAPTEECQNLRVKKRLLRSLESRMSSKSESIRKRLDKRLPLRRFLVAPCDESTDSTDMGAHGSEQRLKEATLAIVEGLPHYANVVTLLSPQAFDPNVCWQTFIMVVYSLPFVDQCRIFWNTLGLECSEGVSPKVAYRGDQLAHLLGGSGFVGGLDNEKGMVVESKVFQAISWSISTQLVSELSHFCRKSPWPDVYTSKSTILAELPLLDVFVKLAPNSLSLASDHSLLPLTAILGPVMGALSPLSVRQWIGQNFFRLGNRKTKVRAVLHRNLTPLVRSLCAADYQKEGPKTICQSSVEAKTSLSEIKKEHPEFSLVDRARELSCQQLGTVTGTQLGCRFINLGDLAEIPGSMHLLGENLGERRRLHADHLARKDRDRVWSLRMLADMVNPINGDLSGRD